MRRLQVDHYPPLKSVFGMPKRRVHCSTSGHLYAPLINLLGPLLQLCCGHPTSQHPAKPHNYHIPWRLDADSTKITANAVSILTLVMMSMRAVSNPRPGSVRRPPVVTTLVPMVYRCLGLRAHYRLNAQESRSQNSTK